jgi:diaminopimelate epimerase
MFLSCGSTKSPIQFDDPQSAAQQPARNPGCPILGASWYLRQGWESTSPNPPLNNPASSVLASLKEPPRITARHSAGLAGNRRAPHFPRFGGRLIPFTKAHACGNDFLIVTEEAAADQDRAGLARRLCKRNSGIGADGVEFFVWIQSKLPGQKSARICLHNADGSIAEISGNGTRCVAAFMAEALGSQPGDNLSIETDAGLRVCRIDAREGHTVQVTTGMGVPRFVPHTLKLTDGAEIVGVEVSTGNPHFVILVESSDFSVDRRLWTVVGAEICEHRDFPQQTNVEFVSIVNEHEIEIRIFERGVGPTTSSGTGSSAAATAALALRRCVSPLTVVAPGGAQTVTWQGPGTELHLTGPAALIARGEAW